MALQPIWNSKVEIIVARSYPVSFASPSASIGSGWSECTGSVARGLAMISRGVAIPILRALGRVVALLLVFCALFQVHRFFTENTATERAKELPKLHGSFPHFPKNLPFCVCVVSDEVPRAQVSRPDGTATAGFSGGWPCRLR